MIKIFRLIFTSHLNGLCFSLAEITKRLYDVWQFNADQEILTKDSKVSLLVFPHLPLTIMLKTSDRVGGRAIHVNRMPCTMK